MSLSLLLEGRKGKQSGEAFAQATTTDISVGGACFKTSHWPEIMVDDVISVSVSIPRQLADKFPFSRIVGKARVVRIEQPLPLQGDGDLPERGIALEFAPDMVFLARAV